MSEARNVIIVILVLLFIFVGIGVAISRVAKTAKQTDKTSEISIIDRIFFNKKDATPTAAIKAPATSVTSTPESAQSPQPIVIKDTKDNKTFTFDNQQGKSVITTKGGITPAQPSKPNSIPATGTPSFVILLALLGLLSGVYLHKKA